MLLNVRGVSKSFPGVKSLDGVDFATEPGEVRALVGENGAGKSTLIKVISGTYRPDEGEIEFDGRRVSWSSPHEARVAGIHVIYQELALFPERTVAQNIFVGDQPRGRFGLIDRRKMNNLARQALRELGVELNLNRLVKTLSVADQQMVEIARALVSQAKLVIFDEPTAAIGGPEVELLFAMIRRLKAQGVGIVFVSHRLDEVFAIADTVTVLKDGALVATRPVAGLTRANLVSMMVGRELATIFPRRPPTHRFGDVAVGVADIWVGNRVKGVSLEVRRGEIVGLAGMVGAGRTDVAQAIFGGLPIDRGTITIGGRAFTRMTPRQAIDAGVGLLTEDRKSEGLFMLLGVAANITAPTLKQITRYWTIDQTAERQIADGEIRRYGIAARGANAPVVNLSGGNQQKVLLGRWVRTCRGALLLDEPTRGVDVGAKMEIYRIIRALADDGLAILMISSEMQEIIGLCDRVVVLCNGAKTGELESDEITEENLLRLAIASETSPPALQS